MRWLRGILLGFLGFLLIVTPVLAIGDPTSIAIGDVYVFRSVLVTNDWLIYVRYDADYTSAPSEPAYETWEMALYDTDGTTLLASRPLDYYQHSMTSLYFTPTQVTSLGLAWEDALYIRVRGMPSVFSPLIEGTNQRTRTLGSGDYYEKASLGGVMLTQAGIFQADWVITLLVSGKLNATGATYFNKAVPGLNSMVPSIYQITKSSPALAYENVTPQFTIDIETRRGVFITDMVQGLATWWHVPYGAAALIVAVGLWMLIASILMTKVNNALTCMFATFPVFVMIVSTGIEGNLLQMLVVIFWVVIVIFMLYFLARVFAG